jgi:hypothetical protein
MSDNKLAARVRHTGAMLLEQQFDSLNQMMNDAVREKLPGYYMTDFSEDSVLLRSSEPSMAPMSPSDMDVYYLASYMVLDGEVTFGTPVKVERVVSYVEVSEQKK